MLLPHQVAMKRVGKKQDSLELHQKSLHIREATLGRMHKDVAVAMNNLAVRSGDQSHFFGELYTVVCVGCGMWSVE